MPSIPNLVANDLITSNKGHTSSFIWPARGMDIASIAAVVQNQHDQFNPNLRADEGLDMFGRSMEHSNGAAFPSGCVEIEQIVVGRSAIAVVAPHAGSIEPLTGDLAAAIAGREHRYYGYVGKTTPRALDLRVPAVRFDEPGLRSVLNGARTAIAIDGAPGLEDAVTLIGGVNRRLVLSIRRHLEAAGFAVMDASDAMDACDPRNVANRVPEGGVQLLLTERLRQDLRGGWLRRLRFEAYVHAVRVALSQEQSLPGPTWEHIRLQSASAAN